MRTIWACLVLLLSAPVFAGVDPFGSAVRYFGTGVSDNDILFTTGDMSQYDACVIMTTTGAVDVLVSLDGTNYSTAALSLQDFGAVDNNPVLVTVALRVYGFVGKYKKIKVLQNGATAAAASMNCWNYGG